MKSQNNKLISFFNGVSPKKQDGDLTRGMAFNTKVMSDHQKKAEEKLIRREAKFEIENDSDSEEEKKTPVQGEVMSSSSDDESDEEE